MFGYVDCFDGRLVDPLEIGFHSSKLLTLSVRSERSVIFKMKSRTEY